jgi:RNA polymerase sigma factor (sigma-70 family)
MADLAARVGSDEKRLSRTIVRINTIEATSPLANGDHFDEACLPTALVPTGPDAPDRAYEKTETKDRVRAAIQSLPWRERKVIGLYYYGEVTMKQIGEGIGVNESRVSQLHARAIRRLRDALGAMQPHQVADMQRELLAFASRKPKMVKAQLPSPSADTLANPRSVVLPYAPTAAHRRPAPAKAAMRMPRQAVAAAR